MRGLARAYAGLYALIGLACGLLIGGIALGITVDVLLRNVPRAVAWLRAQGVDLGLDAWLRARGLGSLPWVMEVNEYALYIVTALGAPWALYRGAHVRVDVLLRGLPRRLGRWMEAATDVIGFAASAGLLYYALMVASTSFRENARVIKILIIPEWWVYAVVVAGAALLMVEFVRRVRLAWVAGPHRDGVPV
jgi:TRAP-type C4-dicarboxylate transport system permease small subunit